MTKRLVSVLALLLQVASLLAEQSDTVRVAVMAEDSLAESHALADLLAIELLDHAGIEILERTEIERVLSEQQLTAIGLLSGAEGTVLLGRIIGAQGFVFLQYDALHRCWIVRLVEARHGFLAGQFSIPSEGLTLSAAAQAVCKQLADVIPKLSLPAESHIFVSLLSFSHAHLHHLERQGAYSYTPESIEGVFSMRLAERISREPKMLVAERRRVRELLDESELIAAMPRVVSSHLLLDGELATRADIAASNVQPAVTFTIRFRDGLLQERERLVRHGESGDLDALFEQTVVAVIEKLKTFRDQPLIARKEESAGLLAVARQQGALWAAEAAYALDPGNPETRDALIELLMQSAEKQLVWPGVDDYRRLAWTLNKIEQVCRENNLSLIQCITPYSRGKFYFHSNLLSNLRGGLMATDPVCLQLTQSFRDRLRRDIEEMKCADEPYESLFHWLVFLFPDSAERRLFEQSLLRRMMENPKFKTQRQVSTRVLRVARTLASCNWSVNDFKAFAALPCPVSRYFANIRLMRLHFTPETRRPYALAALRDLPEILRAPGLWTRPSMIDSKSPSVISLSGKTIQRLIWALPEHRDDLLRSILGVMEQARANKNVWLLWSLNVSVFLKMLDVETAKTWIDEVTQICESITDDKSSGFRYVAMLLRDDLAALGAKLQQVPLQPTIEPVDQTVHRQVLLSREGIGDAWRFPLPAGFTQALARGDIYPQVMMLEGHILWLGLGGKVGGRQRSGRQPHMSGLLAVDLESSQIAFLQYGTLAGTHYSKFETGHRTSFEFGYKHLIFRKLLGPLSRWDDQIVIPHYPVGFLIYPTELWKTVRGNLANIEIINDANSGLVNNHTERVAGLGDNLFVVIRENDPNIGGLYTHLLMKWDRQSKQAVLLWDTKQKIPSPGVNRELSSFHTLHADLDAGRIILDNGRLQYDPLTQGWSHASRDYVTGTRLSPTRKQPPQIWPKLEVPTFDTVNWQNGTLAITGSEENWKLEYFTRIPAQEP